MDSQTLYEVNGTVTVDLPMELNNAYIIGLDSGEDKLVKASGDLFTGTTGGSIRVLTLVASSGKVFNITGDGSPNLIFRDCIVADSAEVGLIKRFSLVFLSIVQYVGNAKGVVYEDIKKLLLSNTGWFSNNSGTYERLKGVFGLVQKQGGFSEVSGSGIGFDVSAHPIITGDAVMEVVFTGDYPVGYVKRYADGSYTGFNFNNSWNVRCAGIPTEGDSFATGSVYHNRATSPTTTVPAFAALSNGIKLDTNNSVTFTNLFRTSIGFPAQNNRITYLGEKPRIFQVNGVITFDTSSSTASEYVFYIMKVGSGGSLIPQIASETYFDANAGYIQVFPVQGTVQLDINESVEIWGKRTNSGAANVVLKSINLSIK